MSEDTKDPRRQVVSAAVLSDTVSGVMICCIELANALVAKGLISTNEITQRWDAAAEDLKMAPPEHGSETIVRVLTVMSKALSSATKQENDR